MKATASKRKNAIRIAVDANKGLLFLYRNACRLGILHLPLHALPLPHDIWHKEWQIRVEVESTPKEKRMALVAKGRSWTAAAVLAMGMMTGTGIAEAAQCGNNAAGYNAWLQQTLKEAPSRRWQSRHQCACQHQICAGYHQCRPQSEEFQALLRRFHEEARSGNDHQARSRA